MTTNEKVLKFLQENPDGLIREDFKSVLGLDSTQAIYNSIYRLREKGHTIEVQDGKFRLVKPGQPVTEIKAPNGRLVVGRKLEVLEALKKAGNKGLKKEKWICSIISPLRGMGYCIDYIGGIYYYRPGETRKSVSHDRDGNVRTVEGCKEYISGPKDIGSLEPKLELQPSTSLELRHESQPQEELPKVGPVLFDINKKFVDEALKVLSPELQEDLLKTVKKAMIYNKIMPAFLELAEVVR